jgi:hypothetical protein
LRKSRRGGGHNPQGPPDGEVAAWWWRKDRAPRTASITTTLVLDVCRAHSANQETTKTRNERAKETSICREKSPRRPTLTKIEAESRRRARRTRPEQHPRASSDPPTTLCSSSRLITQGKLKTSFPLAILIWQINRPGGWETTGGAGVGSWIEYTDGVAAGKIRIQPPSAGFSSSFREAAGCPCGWAPRKEVNGPMRARPCYLCRARPGAESANTGNSSSNSNSRSTPARLLADRREAKQPAEHASSRRPCILYCVHARPSAASSRTWRHRYV